MAHDETHHVGYKKVMNDYIVKLRIEGQNNEHREGVKNEMHAAYRCSKAFVLDIYHMFDKTKRIEEGYGLYDPTFIYRVGEYVKVKKYDTDPTKVFSRGIHYFLSEKCAFFWHFYRVKYYGYTGLYEEWYENGQLFCRITYKDGKKNGLYEGWHPSGQLGWRETYKNGKINGLYESWYENGQLSYRIMYKDGKKNGLYETWYENGQLGCRTTYKDRKKNGMYEEWYENGQLCCRTTFKDGKGIKRVKKIKHK